MSTDNAKSIYELFAIEHCITEYEHLVNVGIFKIGADIG